MYKVPKRDKEFGVGKRMGDNLYFHISYASEIIGIRKFNKAVRIAKKTFETKFAEHGGKLEVYDTDNGIQVIKYNKKMNKVSFMYCCEFDSTLEPGVTGYICVDLNTESGSIRNYKKDYPIYHHKWLMVRDDYKGFYNFPMEVVKKRSENIEKIMNCGLFDIDTKRIGMYSYWETYARPVLRSVKGWKELVMKY